MYGIPSSSPVSISETRMSSASIKKGIFVVWQSWREGQRFVQISPEGRFFVHRWCLEIIHGDISGEVYKKVGLKNGESLGLYHLRRPTNLSI